MHSLRLNFHTLFCASMLIAGCASGNSAGVLAMQPDDSAASATEASDAGRVAMALSRGEAALEANDRISLKAAIRELEALGAGRLDDSESDLVAEWRRVVPDLDPPMRGRALGPAYRKGQLTGQAKDTIDQLFLSGKKASVALEGPGGVRPELAIFDAQNKPVCGPKDRDRRCQWIPIFTQRYRIEIANPGDAAIRYYLVIE